jgi:hypothetical protein
LPFLVFPLVLLWRPLFAGEAFFWGTPLLQFVPWQQLAADVWRSGHLPLWNPLVGCGAPLAANYQTAAFYPLNALHLVVRADVALSWTVALHLALTGWGMFRWGRSVGLDRFPALIGALTLEGSGFLVTRAALFPSIALIFPWLAVWLWRGERLVQTARLRDALWLGLALGLGLLAGHAQTAFYGGLILAAYLLLRTLQEVQVTTRESKTSNRASRVWALRLVVRVAFLFFSLVLGLALAAVQLLPTAEFLMQSHRSTGVSDNLAMTYSFWPWRLITLAAPDFFGNPGQGTYWGYATYWEDAAHVGLLPLLLAIGAVIQAVGAEAAGSRKWEAGSRECETGRTGSVSYLASSASRSTRSLTGFWAVSAAMALVLALGRNTPVFPFLFRHVPGFDLFRAPARWLAVTTIALAALAGIGAQRWPSGHRGHRVGALAATVGGALLIGGLAAPRMISDIPSTFGPATVRLGSTMILAGALALLRRDTGWWQATVATFVAVDLLTVGWSLVPTVHQSLYRGDAATAAVVRGERDQVRIYWPTDPDNPRGAYDAQYRVKFDYLRFADFGPRDVRYWRGMREAQLPNAGMLDGVPSANNFDPLLVGRYADVLQAAVETPDVLGVMGVTHVASDRAWSGGEPAHSTDSVTFYRLSNALGRAWIVPEARGVDPDDTLEALTDPTFDPSTEVLLERGVAGQPGDPQEGVSVDGLVLQDSPNCVTIRATADAPGYLVLADTWYPGWQATVDGEPAAMMRANHAFRAVQLEAGEHEIEMLYRPRLVLVGGVTTLIALVLLIFGMFASRRENA